MKHWALVLPLLAVGCGSAQDANHDGIADGVLKPDTVSVVAPSTPKGTVSGQILDTRLQPLSDVTVSMTIGSATTDAPVTAKSDAAGNFMFSSVPAGSQVLLTFTKDGYATLRANAGVPANAGNIPINDGNASVGMVALAEARSTVRFTLITPSGRPATGAQAYIQAVPSGVAITGGSSVNSSVVGTAQADAQGVITFGNMPSAPDLQRIGTLGGYGAASIGYQLWVDPVDLNGDGIYDSAGYSRLIPASDLANYGPSRIIELTPPINEGTSAAAFSLKVSNVASLTGTSRDPLRNLLRTNESIYMAFTQPVVKNSLLVTVTDEGGAKGSTTATPTANATSDAFSAPLPGSLTAPGASGSSTSITEGQHYNVLVRATSAYDGTTVSYRGYFIAGDVKSPQAGLSATVAFKDAPTGTLNRLDAGECVVVTFSQVVVPPDSGVAVEAFFNFPLGNTGNKGEYGTTGAAASTTPIAGFPLTPIAPPLNIANCLTELPNPYPIDKSFVYTPRYYFAIQTGSSISVPPGTTTVRLAFNKQSLLGAGMYETAWATPLTQDIDVPLTQF